MRFMQWFTLLPISLLFSVFFHLPLVPECRGSASINVSNTRSFESDAVLEQEMLRLTNRQRIQYGLKPLIPDDALIKIAREHSYEMAQQGFISHDQPSGDLKTRMIRAGYLYETARENVARAATLSLAQRLLNSSPPHKSNILAADVTRIGVGIVQYNSSRDKHLYITEIFAVPREHYPWTAVQKLAVDRLNELRWQNGILSAQPDPLFEDLALRSISSLEVPFQRKELRRLLEDSAGELISKGRTEFSRLDVSVQLLHNPDNLVIPEQAGSRKAGMFGTAVRKITDNKNQDSFLVLTLIGFTR